MTDADGYFSPRNHPQRIVYISDDPDSELDDPEISDSELEPIGERTPLFRPPNNPKQNGPSLPSPPYNHSTTTYGSTPIATGVMTSGGEHSFNDAIGEAAPPYYSADHNTHHQHVCTENCNCGARSGERIQEVAPEDKGWRHPDIIRDPWGTFQRIRKEHTKGEICRWIFIRIAFVFLASFLVAKMFMGFHGPGGHGHGHGRGPPGRGPPGRGPHGGPYPGPPPPDDPGRKWPEFNECPPGPGRGFFSQKKYTFFGASSFAFTEISTQEFTPWDRGGHIQVLGDVLVQSVEGLNNVTVDFDIRTTERELEDNYSIELNEQGVLFKTNRTPFRGLHGCIEVRATISVPLSKPEFPRFSVRTETLNVILQPSIDLVVDELSLETIAGSVITRSAFGVESKSTVIIIDSGNIDGDFGLLDLVRLETKSGSINAHVFPQDSNSYIAEYVAATMSGHIKTTFPKNTTILPLGRSYRSKVDTVSGSISGNYLLGDSLYQGTVSGSITASVTATGQNHSTIITDTRQGSTNISFTNNLGDGNKSLTAKHTSISGPVRVEYPEDWEGVVTGNSISGSVRITGDGVVIVEDRKWPAGRFVKGVKGAGEYGGTSECSAISGSVNVFVATS